MVQRRERWRRGRCRPGRGEVVMEVVGFAEGDRLRSTTICRKVLEIAADWSGDATGNGRPTGWS